MNVTGETILVLVFLLPGFLSSTIVNAVATRKIKNGLGTIIEALAFSIWIYAATALLTGQSPKFIPGSGGTELGISYPSILPLYLIVMLVFTLGTPLLVGASITHDWHMKFLRRIRVTNKTARDTVWMDVFSEIEDRYIVVNLKDGRRIYGWPQYYSNDPEEGMLYVHNPYWIDEDGNYSSAGRHGILFKEESIEFIEFMAPVHIAEE